MLVPSVRTVCETSCFYYQEERRNGYAVKFLFSLFFLLGGGGQGGGSPGEKRVGGVREAGEERARSGSSKRAGSGRKMRNAIFLSSTMR